MKDHFMFQARILVDGVESRSIPNRPITRRVFLSCLIVAMLWIGSLFRGVGESLAAGWTTVEERGVQWLVTPEGKRVFSKGVNLVDGWKETEKTRENVAFYWGNHYASIADWRRSASERLRAWGFNTLGGWSDPSPELGHCLTVDLELGRNAEFHWFDPFDPAMQGKVAEWAERLTAPYRNDPRLLGYFSDNEVGWWNSPLFQWFLKREWSNHTKRVLWQTLVDAYGGRWEELKKDWVPGEGINSFQDLKKTGASMKLRPGGDGIRVVDRFMFLIAQRYYELMFGAIRKAHPGALVLGDRLPLYYHQDAIRAMGDNIDVISTNYNVDVPDGWVAPYYFNGLRMLSRKPVLVTEFFYAAEENRSGNLNETARNAHPKPGHLMTVATQAERARGAAAALRNMASFPNVVGAHWFQLYDEPFGGREDGEDYNMGLIDTRDRPYEEVTEMFALLNPQLESIHSESMEKRGLLLAVTPTKDASNDGTYEIVRADRAPDVRDQSLLDWDKETTRVVGFQALEPYIPFGDVHLTWSPDGLYLAAIANTFVDPDFLYFTGEFPLEETFQIHVLVECDGIRKHFGIHLVPHKDSRFPDGFDIGPRLFRYDEGRRVEPLAVDGHVQRLTKSLPHMAVEAFLPAAWLDKERLEAGAKLRMNILLETYYGEMTMAWSGEPSLKSLGDPASMRTVLLQNASEKKAGSMAGQAVGKEFALLRN